MATTKIARAKGQGKRKKGLQNDLSRIWSDTCQAPSTQANERVVRANRSKKGGERGSRGRVRGVGWARGHKVRKQSPEMISSPNPSLLHKQQALRARGHVGYVMVQRCPTKLHG